MACESLGFECAEFSITTPDEVTSQRAGCQGKGDPCEGGYAAAPELAYGTSCEQGTLTTCVNMRRATVDCARLGVGFTCQSYEDQVFCGLASECDPSSEESTCDGAAVVFCNAGRFERVDCTTLGFDGCKAGHCQPGAFSG